MSDSDEMNEENYNNLIKDSIFDGQEELNRNLGSEVLGELFLSYGLSQHQLPTEEKSYHQIFKDNKINDILDQESKDRLNKPCPKCQTIQTIGFSNCNICQREKVMVRCQKCFSSVFDLCSQKCHDIYDGKIALINIKDNSGNIFITIEDYYDGNMALRVVNHSILNQVLTDKDRKMIGNTCLDCKDNILLAPVKCKQCQINYSYIVQCHNCTSKKGLKYYCDDCDN